ncbi:hypothetical protein LTR36_002317 [Oleoguttula mirabilis]|uniref:KANL3/Tex30 alpha/beta hydrolase-like domain-containing protein n=1 Tax=Oleoguttula mirabilis TaxID=1507867 RepID=A0AAV9JME4_9PEZI|nr:hypothetical protein LTR36_002317 [Oleoguttula mirabilis]
MPKKRKSVKRSPQPAVEDEVVNQSAHDEQQDGNRGDGETSARNDNDETAPEQQEVEHFEFPFNNKSIVCERRGKSGQPSLIWTHGAGGGLEAPATKDFADGFAEKAGIVSFKGAMNLVSRTKAFHAVVEHESFDAALGGRSMGARAACIAATQEDRTTKAVVLVSFPLVGGKKQDSREQILLDLPDDIDVLFISGSKDSMCDLEQLADVTARMEAHSWLVTIDAADHGMNWKGKAKDSAQEMRRMTGALAADWLDHRDSNKRHCLVSYDEDAGKISCDGWQEGERVAEKAVDETAPPAKKRRKTK